MKQRSATNIDVHIGARLRAARIEQRYSQDYIAKELGISFQQIQKYEKGINRVSAARLTLFAEHYQRPMKWFLDGSERDDAGAPHADLGSKVLGTTAGRQLCEAWLAIDDFAERAMVLQMAETLARRSVRRLQVAE